MSWSKKKITIWSWCKDLIDNATHISFCRWLNLFYQREKKIMLWFRNSVIQKQICSALAPLPWTFLSIFLFSGCHGWFRKTKESKKSKALIIKFVEIMFGPQVNSFFPLSCTLQSSNYEIKKKRCKYLRSKLSHIKRKISEYDRRPWTITRQNSRPLTRQYLCDFNVGVYIVYYFYHL